jgi:3-oxoacyl-(acyl-carrier-protein) synthase
MMKSYGAVTGLGIVSPFGATEDEFWRGLVEAPNIFSTRTLTGAWSPEPVSCRAGWIDDSLPQTILGARSLRSLSRESRFALAAAVAALRHAHWQEIESGDVDLGVIIGTLYSGHQNFSEASALILRGKPQHINPAQAPESGYNAPASQISILARAQGLNLSVAAGLCSACEAVRLGMDELDAGRGKAMVVGGVDVLSIGLARVQARQSAKAGGTSFERFRGGAPLSEAAACILIERPQDAADRGATIMALVKASDVRFCPTRGVGMIDHVEGVLRDSIKAAGLEPEQIDAVFASANGDRKTDLVEANALYRIFGSVTPVCAVKGATGECLGASGAVLIVAALLALRKNVVPPTLGFVEQDLDSPPLNIARTSSDRDLQHILIVSQDAEGFAGCVVLAGGAGAMSGGVS